MPILTLLGVVVVTLAGAATLALRVVRVPRSDSRRAPAQRGAWPAGERAPGQDGR